MHWLSGLASAAVTRFFFKLAFEPPKRPGILFRWSRARDREHLNPQVKCGNEGDYLISGARRDRDVTVGCWERCLLASPPHWDHVGAHSLGLSMVETLTDLEFDIRGEACSLVPHQVVNIESVIGSVLLELRGYGFACLLIELCH